ncbi:hypothetical protein V1504DRAFT_499520 [Lipomyces starkeyi]
MPQKYLERKARRGLSVKDPLTARRLIDDAVNIQASEVLDEDFKLDVLRAGLLPLLQDFQGPATTPHAEEIGGMVAAFMGRIATIRRPTLRQSSVDTVPQVVMFLSDCKAYLRLKTKQQRSCRCRLSRHSWSPGILTWTVGNRNLSNNSFFDKVANTNSAGKRVPSISVLRIPRLERTSATN